MAYTITHICSGLVGLVGQRVRLVRDIGSLGRVVHQYGTDLINTQCQGIRGAWGGEKEVVLKGYSGVYLHCTIYLIK